MYFNILSFNKPATSVESQNESDMESMSYLISLRGGGFMTYRAVVVVLASLLGS